MSHKAALQTLIPLELGGVHDIDLTVEGHELDAVATDLEVLRQEIINDPAGLIPTNNRIHLAPIRGDIKKPYFVTLAAALGYTIRIDDYTDTMSDWAHADEPLIEEPWNYFTAGISMAGDYLAQENTILPWLWEVVVITSPVAAPTPDLETLLTDIKPAHIKLNFTYL